MTKNDGSEQIVPDGGREGAGRGFLGILRTVALIAVAIGAVGAVSLTIRAGSSSPWLLQVLFVIWVLLPFVALAWTTLVSRHWAALTRATLYGVTLFIALGSLAIYGGVIPPPVGSAHAFVFVVVPAASWLLMAIFVPLAALISRRRSR